MPLRAVAMHAVSSDESEGFRPCIYAQIEGGAPEGSLSRRFTPAETARDAAAGEEEDGAAEEDETTELEETTELRLAPADPAALGALFKALCDCAALNPDPEDEMHETDDAEDDEDWGAGGEEEEDWGAVEEMDASTSIAQREAGDVNMADASAIEGSASSPEEEPANSRPKSTGVGPLRIGVVVDASRALDGSVFWDFLQHPPGSGHVEVGSGEDGADLEEKNHQNFREVNNPLRQDSPVPWKHGGISRRA